MNGNPVTWIELSSVLSVLSIVLIALFGFAWKIVSGLNKAIMSLRLLIDEHRIEVAKTYATTSAVVQIEERLTRSIDNMAKQLGSSLDHMGQRVETVFGQVMSMMAKNR